MLVCERGAWLGWFETGCTNSWLASTVARISMSEANCFQDEDIEELRNDVMSRRAPDELAAFLGI